MSRSSPSAPGYLHGAISRVERLLAERYPEPMTAREVADALTADGYRWPLPEGYVHVGGRTVFRETDEADPTPERVRRVCELKHNRTCISHAGHRGRFKLYSIYPWAMPKFIVPDVGC